MHRTPRFPTIVVIPCRCLIECQMWPDWPAMVSACRAGCPELVQLIIHGSARARPPHRAPPRRARPGPRRAAPLPAPGRARPRPRKRAGRKRNAGQDPSTIFAGSSGEKRRARGSGAAVGGRAGAGPDSSRISNPDIRVPV